MKTKKTKTRYADKHCMWCYALGSEHALEKRATAPDDPRYECKDTAACHVRYNEVHKKRINR